MKLVTLDIPPHGRAGVLVGDEVLHLAHAAHHASLDHWIPDTVAGILHAGDAGLDVVRRLAGLVADGPGSRRERLRERGALTPFDETPLMAPLPAPGLILSAGMAYGSHLEEMGTPPPPNPVGFIKLSRSVIGTRTPIVLPPQAPDMVDFEGEFSIVIGKPCHDASADEAMACVGGYTIVNDVSARDWAEEFIRKGDAFRNTMGKQFPTFCPLGPVVVTADEVSDPHALTLTTTLNGEVYQQAETGDLIFSVAETIAYFSKWYAFQPGDVITTGSPGGVGYARDPKVFMRPGDVVSVEVCGIGALTNPVVAAETRPESGGRT